MSRWRCPDCGNAESFSHRGCRIRSMNRTEAMAWLKQAPDAKGECDRCHHEADLWSLPSEIETEPEASWLYCSQCFRLIINRHFLKS